MSEKQNGQIAQLRRISWTLLYVAGMVTIGVLTILHVPPFG